MMALLLNYFQGRQATKNSHRLPYNLAESQARNSPCLGHRIRHDSKVNPMPH